MAVGANVTNGLRMVIVEGMRPMLFDVAIGMAASLQLRNVVSRLTYSAGATDVPTFVSVSLLLVSVAFVARILPAYFATKVDPLEMLRNE